MEDSYTSSSEDEMDEAELEIALYSQIHFDPATDSVASNTYTRAPFPTFSKPAFDVGVQSYKSKEKKRKSKEKKHAVLNLDFVSFDTDSTNAEPTNIAPTAQERTREGNDRFHFKSDSYHKHNIDSKVDVGQSSQIADAPTVNPTEGKKPYRDKNVAEEGEKIWNNCDDDDNDILLAAVDVIEESQFNSSKKKPLVDEPKSSAKKGKVKDPKKKETGCVTVSEIHDDDCSQDDDDDILMEAMDAIEKTDIKMSENKSLPKEKMSCSQNKDKYTIKENKDCGTTSLVKGENYPLDKPMPKGLLSFTITKAPKKVEKLERKSPSPGPEKDSDSEVVIEVKNVKKKSPNAKVALSKKSTKSSKIEEFLQLSKEDPVKSKAVSKQDIAIQKRKPPVVLCHAPTTVVEYHQYSDTNTDYSDSDDEASTTSAPNKGRKSAPKTTLPKTINLEKDSSDTEVASASGLNRNVETVKPVGVVYEIPRSDSDDEEETKANKENEEKNVDESSDSSSETSNSNSDKDDTETNEPLISTSGLDFNLSGGIGALLKAQEENFDPKWTISNQDKEIPRRALSNRYFDPHKEGHSKPRRMVCILCGNPGHVHFKCPNAICFNCFSPGHKFSDCPEPRQDRYVECPRCWMRGHSEEVCPDKWRQYHLTTGLHSTQIVKGKLKPDVKVFCFNCGLKGHLGYECHAPKMNRFVHPFYPYVAVYDKKTAQKRERDNDRRRSPSNKRGEREEEREKGKKKKVSGKARKTKKRKEGCDNIDEIEEVADLQIKVPKPKVSAHERLESNEVKKYHKNYHDHFDEIEEVADLQVKVPTMQVSANERLESNNIKNSFVFGRTLFQFQSPSNSKYAKRRRVEDDGAIHPCFRQADSAYSEDIQEHSPPRYDPNNSWEKDRKGFRSRKEKQKERRRKYEEEVLEEFNNHQASHNEWWKLEDEQEDDFDFEEPSRKHKKKRHHLYDSPESSDPDQPVPHRRPKSSRVSHRRQHHQDQDFFNEEEKDYITLSSRINRGHRGGGGGGRHHSKAAHRGKRGRRGAFGRNVRGGHGFKARDWVMSSKKMF